MLKKYEFILKNLDCANCANKIQNKIAQNSKFKNVIVNFNTLKLTYESDQEYIEIIENIVKSLEPDVEVVKMQEKVENEENQIAFQVLRLVLGIGIAAIGFFAGLPNLFCNILIIIAYFILLYRTIGNAVKLFKISRSINENFLVTVSCLGAYFIGEKLEGLMVIILYEIGKILEDKAVHKTRKSISDLMNIKPEYANLKTSSGLQKISPEEVQIGNILCVKQGEKIPLDGIVISGEANLDTASLSRRKCFNKSKSRFSSIIWKH